MVRMILKSLPANNDTELATILRTGQTFIYRQRNSDTSNSKRPHHLTLNCVSMGQGLNKLYMYTYFYSLFFLLQFQIARVFLKVVYTLKRIII